MGSTLDLLGYDVLCSVHELTEKQIRASTYFAAFIPTDVDVLFTVLDRHYSV